MKDRNDYTIEPYNSEWPLMFEKVVKPFIDALGDKVISYHHVGSTAVPGLAAKPIIDALIIVKDIEETDAFKKAFQEADYELRKNLLGPNSRVYTKHDRSSIVHILPKGHPMIEEFIVVRDALRNNAELRLEYADLKSNLKNKFPDDYEAYRAGKKDFLDRIYEVPKTS